MNWMNYKGMGWIFKDGIGWGWMGWIIKEWDELLRNGMECLIWDRIGIWMDRNEMNVMNYKEMGWIGLDLIGLKWMWWTIKKWVELDKIW